MGSGFNFFLNAINKTPSTTGSFVDVDCSGDIPSGTTGVILKINNTDASGQRAEVRKNGSSDNFGLYIGGSAGRYALVGVDTNRIFEAYIATTNTKIYLIGYADENCGFFDNAVNKTPSTVGSWQDVDCSGDIPSDATGVICLLYNTSGSTNYSAGIRKNGSSDEFTYAAIYQSARFSYQLCGVDADRIFEAKTQNAAAKVYLIGYTKSPITFFDNGIDKSLTTTGSWTDIDVTSETDPLADGAIILIKNTHASTQHRSDVRENGSSDNHSPMLLFYGSCAAGLCGLDTDQIFEGYIADLTVDFYVIGYCKPAVGVTDKGFSDVGGGADAFLNPYRAMPFTDTGHGAEAFNTPFRSMGFADVGHGVDLFTLLRMLAFFDTGNGADAFIKWIVGAIENIRSELVTLAGEKGVHNLQGNKGVLALQGEKGEVELD